MLSAYLEFDTGADINQLSSINYYDDDSLFWKGSYNYQWL